VKRSLAYLDRRKAEARAALEGRLAHVADRLSEECTEVVDRHPWVSIGAAGLTGWLAAAASLSGKGSLARGASAGVALAVRRALLLRRIL
jgi:hypothetical protein